MYYEDRLHIDEQVMPEVDLYVAGPPCQPWSLEGHQKSWSDPKSKLMVRAIKYITTKFPKAFIIENVKGIAVVDKGKPAQRIQDEIERTGQYEIHTKSSMISATEYHTTVIDGG